MEPEKTALAKIESNERGMILRTVGDIRTAAQIVHQSKLAPKGYDSPEKVFVGIQAGAELGLKPLQALNSIYVVYGKPTLWGDAALALVKKSGLLKDFHEELVGEGEQMTAKVRSVRIDESGGEPIYTTVESEFSVADAKKARLWNNAGTWQTHPKRMLKYKARAFCLRDNFPDVLMGMHIAEEMIGVNVPETPQSDAPPRELRRRPVQDVKVEDAESVSDKDGSTETEDTGLLYASVFAQYMDAVAQYMDAAPIEMEANEKGFAEYAAFVLCVEEKYVDSPEKFTHEMLTQLQKEIETIGVPESYDSDNS